MDNWMGKKLTEDVQRAVKTHCANASGTKCLLTDNLCMYHRPLADGQQPYRCSGFETAVVQNCPPVEHEYNRRLSQYLNDGTINADARKCKRCGELFTVKGINHQFCKQCKPIAEKEAAKLRQRRRREKQSGM